ncbi:MAG: Uncharacterized protein G01um10148_137 [Parcubacteria group bacterium Gr01-1014_8]|nr:MAG: Uncharacterized protein G01um10148_137 [Parcubacteria group bacterium Gr01-1014_8]
MPESSASPIRWSAYEHEHIERSSDWFWALGIIAVCAAVTSLLFGNVLFALLIIVAAGVIALIAQTPPELHDFEISERGITVSSTLHTYEEILAFWVETENQEEEPLLLVDTVKFMSPNLVIPIGGANPEEIRAYLRERAPEVPMKEPLAHKILEFFGF